ncbi:MAG: hypothetical protein KDA96_06140 [Planctomycetaceae bacterium]|nr:hypothetical protein [Planctomycetaceae bacterium]
MNLESTDASSVRRPGSSSSQGRIQPARSAFSGADETSPADDTLPSTASTESDATIAFVAMDVAGFEKHVREWIERAAADDRAVAMRALSVWTELAGEETSAGNAEQLVDAAVNAFAEVDPGVRRLLKECQGDTTVAPLVYDGMRSDPFYQMVVKLYYARWLSQHRYYDEAISELESFQPETFVDPASLFFYRAVCHMSLLHDDEARDQLTLLLNNTVGIPGRFRILAEMMQQQLGDDTSDGLPLVARTMSDVQRRLDLGRPDQPTQEQEDQVIALLDKLLEDMENQQQQQQGGGQGQGQSDPQGQGGAQPAQDSRLKGSPAEGIADHKELEESGAWGMLDQKQEAAARELIRQQFPGNFLDAISRYTKKVAEQKK